MRNIPFSGDGLLRHSVEEHNSQRASERATERAEAEEKLYYTKTRTRSRDTLRSGRRQTQDPPPQRLSCIQLYSLQAKHILE
jgi:hypothetical protein